jgi:hypothetical protein
MNPAGTATTSPAQAPMQGLTLVAGNSVTLRRPADPLQINEYNVIEPQPGSYLLVAKDDMMEIIEIRRSNFIRTGLFALNFNNHISGSCTQQASTQGLNLVKGDSVTLRRAADPLQAKEYNFCEPQPGRYLLVGKDDMMDIIAIKQDTT